MDPAVRDRLLGIIEARCLTGRNGAAWQAQVVEHLQRHENLSRPRALREMLHRYVERMHSNEPVHTWSVE